LGLTFVLLRVIVLRELGAIETWVMDANPAQPIYGTFAPRDKLYKLGIEAATDAARAGARRGEET
jgi:hypothetical protein